MSISINPTTGQVVNNCRASTRVRGHHPNAKVTQEQVDEMRRLHSQGVPTSAIIERFPIGKSSVNDILRYRTWKPLETQNPEG